MIHKIKALYDDGDGLSIRQIARELNISRNTVRKYLKMEEPQIVTQLTVRERRKQLRHGPTGQSLPSCLVPA